MPPDLPAPDEERPAGKYHIDIEYGLCGAGGVPGTVVRRGRGGSSGKQQPERCSPVVYTFSHHLTTW